MFFKGSCDWMPPSAWLCLEERILLSQSSLSGNFRSGTELAFIAGFRLPELFEIGIVLKRVFVSLPSGVVRLRSSYHWNGIVQRAPSSGDHWRNRRSPEVFLEGERICHKALRSMYASLLVLSRRFLLRSNRLWKLWVKSCQQKAEVWK